MRSWVQPAERKGDPYYDLVDDFDLIVSSFQSQYGIRLSRELLPGGMKWEEFKDLLVGIGPETALGRIVAIRAETDQKIIKKFTADQRKIWNDWRQRRASTMSPKDASAAIEGFRRMFLAAAGINLKALEGSSGST